MRDVEIQIKDFEGMREYDFATAVVANEDHGFIRDMLNRMPEPVKAHLLAFVELVVKSQEQGRD